jgi:hypothetical protein
MPTIMFPDIPLYPGVPQLLRPVQQAIAANPVLSIGLGTAETLLITALNQAPQWGIYDATDGSQLGINPNSQSTLQAIAGTLASQLTGSTAPTLSTFSVEYMRETRVSDFPVENGGFAAYNKAISPGAPIVTLILDGQESDRTTFLEAIDNACQSTNLYNVVTPEIIYANHAIERYSYARKSSKGLTLLIVEISLKEIRQVSPSYSTSPIVSPVNPASTAQVNAGTQQPATPNQSAALSLYNGAINTIKPYLP